MQYAPTQNNSYKNLYICILGFCILSDRVILTNKRNIIYSKFSTKNENCYCWR